MEGVSGPEQISAERSVYTVLSTRFEVPKYYEVISPVGFGAYGFVVAAKDTRTNENVAIKKNSRVFRDLADCKRIVREINVLRFLKHDNVLRLREVYLPIEDGEDFRDVYMVSDLMDTSLLNVIRSQTQKMNESHFKYFIYQILRGLKYLHSASIIHRDLKPANVLVNMNCDLQICDFGLARQLVQDTAMTDYVVTRYYRAPEVLLMYGRGKYTAAVDTWSVGCIMVELVTRHTLFRGADYVKQLDMILCTLVPTEEDVSYLSEPQRSHVMARCAEIAAHPKQRKPLAPSITDPVTRDFISRMLVFDPRRRALPEELLSHPYMAEMHEPHDEPCAEKPFAWEFETADLSEEYLRAELLALAAKDGPTPAPATAPAPPTNEFTQVGTPNMSLSASTRTQSPLSPSPPFAKATATPTGMLTRSKQPAPAAKKPIAPPAPVDNSV